MECRAHAGKSRERGRRRKPGGLAIASSGLEFGPGSHRLVADDRLIHTRDQPGTFRKAIHVIPRLCASGKWNVT